MTFYKIPPNTLQSFSFYAYSFHACDLIDWYWNFVLVFFSYVPRPSAWPPAVWIHVIFVLRLFTYLTMVIVLFQSIWKIASSITSATKDKIRKQLLLLINISRFPIEKISKISINILEKLLKKNQGRFSQVKYRGRQPLDAVKSSMILWILKGHLLSCMYSNDIHLAYDKLCSTLPFIVFNVHTTFWINLDCL